MESRKKDAVKIFLTFLLLYSLFIYWGGQNENSRFALTRAIVDENKLEIDSFYNSTADRALFNGHYYSDKNPGTSFLAVPVYSIWKFLNHAEDGLQNVEYLSFVAGSSRVYEPLRVDNSTLISMILVTISVPSFFGALLIATIFYFLNYFVPDRKVVFLISAFAGLGTAIFTYSIAFLEFILPAFFSFLSFLLIFRMKREKKYDPRILFLAGTLAGFSFVISILTYSVILGLLFYLRLSKIKRVQYFFSGLVIGSLPLFIYIFTIFGTPLTHPIFYLEESIWGEIKQQVLDGQFSPLNSVLNAPFLLLRGLFYPETGLFFYYPILILFPFGLFYFSKRYREEAIFISILFVLQTLGGIVFSYEMLVVGAFFGQKIFVPLIPFLIIPISYLFYHFWKSKVKYLIILLSIYSIFVTLSSLQPKVDLIGDLNAYAEKIFSLEIYGNSLYEYYIPQFLQYGPRSRILENIINSQPMDIRFLTSQEREYFLYFYNYIPFLAILPISLSIVLICWRELKKYKWIVLSLPIILIVVSIAAPKDLAEINFEKGFYPLLPFEDTRWLKDEGDISIYSSSKESELKQFSMLINSYYKNRTYELLLNNELVDTGTFSKQQLEYSWVLRLKPGKSILTLRSKCDIPTIIGGKNETRCLGIGISNFSIMVFNRSLLFSKGWHPKASNEDVTWMPNNGEILIDSPADTDKNYELSLYLLSFSINRNIEIFVNDNLIDSVEVPKYGIIDKFIIALKPGINTIKLSAEDTCQIPKETGVSDDIRCLSIGIRNVSISPFIENQTDNILFSRSWHPKASNEDVTWMHQDGSIVFYTDNEKTGLFRFVARSFLSDRDVKLFFNRNPIDNFKIFVQGNEVYTSVINLSKGKNTLEFIPLPECSIVSEIDSRCISIGLKEIEFIPLESIINKNTSFIFSKNWYKKYPEDTSQWMNNNGTVVFFYYGTQEPVKINLDILPFLEEKNIEFYLNDELKNIFTVTKGGYAVSTLPQSLKVGPNYFRFYVKEDCIVVDNVLHNGDKRCFSMTIRNITLG